MYQDFFHLKELPFSLTPDPKFLFMSRSHREAFDHLLFGIHERRGFIEVVGGIGTGKTTLCRALLQELEGQVATAVIFNTFMTELELLRSINEEFGIDASGSTRKALIDELNRFLIEQLAKGGNACLILDECQNLEVSVLEQIRMLSNLETESEKLLQIVMMGQPEFHEMLLSTPLRQLNERIQIRSFLQPLDREDTQAYIAHRLAVAGSKGDLHFSEGAVRIIYEYSQGNPRRINTICDRCLLIAYTQETHRITREHARRAVKELDGALGVRLRSRAENRSHIPRMTRWLLWILLGIVVISGGWWLGRSLPLFLSPMEKRMEGASRVTGAPQMEVPDLSSAKGSMKAIKGPLSSSSPKLFAPLLLWEEVGQGSSVEEAAAEAGMAWTRLNFSWEDLLRVRRSCLLELRKGDGQALQYVLLRGISEDGAWIEEQVGQVEFRERRALEGEWYGGVWVAWPPTYMGGMLRLGDSGDPVVQLKKSLRKLGYWQGEIHGIFDGPTQKAVMAFQRDHHLPVDGVVGKRTKGMLFVLVGEDRGSP
jgi:general secretion pathway protein A